MIVNNPLHALTLRMFITYLLNNLSQVNGLLSTTLSNANVMRVVLFDLSGLAPGGALVTVTRHDGKLTLNILGGDQTQHFKLGHLKSPISKRLINDIEVYFHRALRLDYVEAIRILDTEFSIADVKHKARNIPLVCRLFYKPMEYDIKFYNPLVEILMKVHVTIRRSIFNKLMVTVSTTGVEPNGILRSLMPVHIGVTNTYLADGKSDPVNQWFRQVLKDHVDLFHK